METVSSAIFTLQDGLADSKLQAWSSKTSPAILLRLNKLLFFFFFLKVKWTKI